MKMDHWVWLDCDKHRYKQLRDLVVVGPLHVEDEEYIRCGCRYKTTDPDAAISSLRAYEASRNAEMAARFASALAPKPTRALKFSPEWLLWLIFVPLAVFLWRRLS